MLTACMLQDNDPQRLLLLFSAMMSFMASEQGQTQEDITSSKRLRKAHSHRTRGWWLHAPSQVTS